MDNPLHHFELHPLIHISLMGIDISINKAIIAMWVGLVGVFFMFFLVVRGGLKVIPGKMQNLAEMSVLFLRDMVKEYIGKEGFKYFPFVATLFFFIFSCNLIGLIPGSYTITSQVVMTGAFAVVIFMMTIVIGFLHHGAHYISVLVPPGVPGILIPFMIPIEVISLLARPITLALRLFANMLAGHALMTVLFTLAMTGGVVIGWLPFGFTVLINGLEIFICFIQAYIFALLTCVYIGDAIKLH